MPSISSFPQPFYMEWVGCTLDCLLAYFLNACSVQYESNLGALQYLYIDLLMVLIISFTSTLAHQLVHKIYPFTKRCFQCTTWPACLVTLIMVLHPFYSGVHICLSSAGKKTAPGHVSRNTCPCLHGVTDMSLGSLPAWGSLLPLSTSMVGNLCCIVVTCCENHYQPTVSHEMLLCNYFGTNWLKQSHFQKFLHITNSALMLRNKCCDFWTHTGMCHWLQILILRTLFLKRIPWSFS